MHPRAQTSTPVILVAVVLGGCGLDSAGLLPSSVDAGPDATDDATVLPLDATVDAPPPPPLPDAANCLDTGPCTKSVPGGWTLVVSPPDPNSACPTGWASNDSMSQVAAKVGACDCACTITKDPVCDKGQVTFYYAMDANCGNTGVMPTFPGCKDVGRFNINSYEKMAKLPPTDGACTSAVKEDKSLVDKSARRTCDVAAKCAEDVCRDGLTGWGTCITKGADEACPTGWNAKREVVGSDFDLNCSSCGTCDVNGASTCGTATVGMYTDSNCTNQAASFVVDGTCKPVTGAGASVRYAKYLPGTLTKGCFVPGLKTAAPTLKGKSTICCK